jgi:hypothetical protein
MKKKKKPIIIDRDTYEMMRRLKLLNNKDKEYKIMQPINRTELEQINLDKQLEKIRLAKEGKKRREENKS